MILIGKFLNLTEEHMRRQKNGDRAVKPFGFPYDRAELRIRWWSPPPLVGIRGAVLVEARVLASDVLPG